MFGGYPPTAIGYTPTAIGYPPTAIGYPPTAIGYPPTAIGYTPTAMGYPPTAIGYPPTAISYPPAAIIGRIGHSEFFFFFIMAALAANSRAVSAQRVVCIVQRAQSAMSRVPCTLCSVHSVQCVECVSCGVQCAVQCAGAMMQIAQSAVCGVPFPTRGGPKLGLDLDSKPVDLLSAGHLLRTAPPGRLSPDHHNPPRGLRSPPHTPPEPSTVLQPLLQVLRAGDYFALPSVVYCAEEYLAKAITTGTIKEVWYEATQGAVPSEWLQRQAVRFLRIRFKALLSDDVLRQVPKDLLLIVLRSDFLAAQEHDVLQVVLRWQKVHATEEPVEGPGRKRKRKSSWFSWFSEDEAAGASAQQQTAPSGTPSPTVSATHSTTASGSNRQDPQDQNSGMLGPATPTATGAPGPAKTPNRNRRSGPRKEPQPQPALRAPQRTPTATLKKCGGPQPNAAEEEQDLIRYVRFPYIPWENKVLQKAMKSNAVPEDLLDEKWQSDSGHRRLQWQNTWTPHPGDPFRRYVPRVSEQLLDEIEHIVRQNEIKNERRWDARGWLNRGRRTRRGARMLAHTSGRCGFERLQWDEAKEPPLDRDVVKVCTGPVPRFPSLPPPPGLSVPCYFPFLQRRGLVLWFQRPAQTATVPGSNTR